MPSLEERIQAIQAERQAGASQPSAALPLSSIEERIKAIQAKRGPLIAQPSPAATISPPSSEPSSTTSSLTSRLLKITPELLSDFTIGPFIEAGHAFPLPPIFGGDVTAQGQSAASTQPPTEEKVALKESGQLTRPISSLSNEELIQRGGPLMNLALLSALGERGGVGRVPSGFDRGFFTRTLPPAETLPSEVLPPPPAVRRPVAALPPAPPLVITPEGQVIPRQAGPLGLTQQQIARAQQRLQTQPPVPPESSGSLRPPRTPPPPPSPVQESISTPSQSFAAAIPKNAPAFLKSRARAIDTLTLSDFERGGAQDALSKLGLSPANEANRTALNLIIHFENQGLDPTLVNPTSKDFGLFQVSPNVAKEIGFSYSPDPAVQLREVEGRFLPKVVQRIGSDDPRAVALGHLNQVKTREAVKTLGLQPVGVQAKESVAVVPSEVTERIGGVPITEGGLPLADRVALLKRTGNPKAASRLLAKEGGAQPSLIRTQATMPPEPLRPSAGQVEQAQLLEGFRPPPPPPRELPLGPGGQTAGAAKLAATASPRPGKPTIPPLIQGGGPGGAEILSGGNVNAVGPFTRPALDLATFDKVISVAGDVFEQLGIPVDKSQKRLIQHLKEVVASGQAPVPELERIGQARGISVDELYRAFADSAGEDVTTGAQEMNLLSQIAKRIAQSQPVTEEQQRSLMQRLGGIYRASLVGQPVVAARNLISNVGRLGLDALTDSVDIALQRLVTTGTPASTRALTKPFARLLEGSKAGGSELVAPFKNVGAKLGVSAPHTPSPNEALVTSLLSRSPSLQGKLFRGFASDVLLPSNVARASTGRIDALLTAWERGLGVVNTPNVVQEFFARRIGFLTKMEQRVRARGITTPLEQIDMAAMARRDFPKFEKDLRASVDHALDLTFAKDPTLNSFGDHFVKAVNKIPFPVAAALNVIFPRFMVNSMSFLNQHLFQTPTTFLKLLSSAERAKIAAGDTRALSRAVISVGMLGAAIAARASPYAGDKFSEFKLDPNDPRTQIDTQAFNPWGAFLFLGDLAVKGSRGQLASVTGRDAIKGLLSVNLRGSAGTFVFDKMFDLLKSGFNEGGQVTAASARRFTESLVAEVGSGFLAPLLTIKDFVASVDPNEAIVRDVRRNPLGGPFADKIPFVSQTLPPRPGPLRSAPQRRIFTAGKQVTGLRAIEKTPVEAEFDRLGVPFRTIIPAQSTPELEAKLAAALGPQIERAATNLFASPRYQRADFDRQRAQAIELTNSIRSAIKPGVLQTLSPEAQIEHVVKQQPSHLRPLFLRIPAVKRAIEGQSAAP